MPDFAYEEMKKLFPGADDDEMIQKIAALDQPKPSAIQGPETLIEANMPNPYKDMAIQNVKDKYGLDDKYSNESRQKLLEEVKQSASGPNWSAGLAALGTGIAGGNAAAAGESILKRQSDERENKITQFDLGRKNALISRDDAAAQEKMKRESDPNSIESKMAQDLAVQMGMNPEQAAGLTAAKFKEFSPVMEKKYQIAQSSLDKKEGRLAAEASKDEARAYADAVRSESRADRKQDRAESAAARKETQDEKAEEKRKTEAKLNPKQVEGIADFDTTIAKAEAALNSLGEHSDWTGSLDSRVPDMFVSGDQVAFRSAVGRMADAYRKLITGAGASNQELARLEGRLPQSSDTFENFKAKAKSLIDETKKARSTHLKTYQQSGKDVSEFTNEVPDQSGEQKPSWAK